MLCVCCSGLVRLGLRVKAWRLRCEQIGASFTWHQGVPTARHSVRESSLFDIGIRVLTVAWLPSLGFLSCTVREGFGFRGKGVCKAVGFRSPAENRTDKKLKPGPNGLGSCIACSG